MATGGHMPNAPALHECVEWDKIVRWASSKGYSTPPLTIKIVRWASSKGYSTPPLTQLVNGPFDRLADPLLGLGISVMPIWPESASVLRLSFALQQGPVAAPRTAAAMTC